MRPQSARAWPSMHEETVGKANGPTGEAARAPRRAVRWRRGGGGGRGGAKLSSIVTHKEILVSGAGSQGVKEEEEEEEEGEIVIICHRAYHTTVRDFSD
jgi:hypothetical protein